MADGDEGQMADGGEMAQQPDTEDLIAIVGMAGRFPGSRDVAEFWQNALAGTEAVVEYSRDELIAAGEDPALVDDPQYVRSGAPLEDHDRFDAKAFGYTPREARLMDPQVRIFLECAWAALEDAGCDPDRYRERAAVFAAAGMTRYLWLNAVPALGSSINMLEARILNDKDFLASAASYRLGLRGPAVSVQTACSASLVAVHQAVQSLLSHESDLALAGGSTIELPHRIGYLYKEGSIGSPDGHCRPFDHRAEGTIGGSGAGAVALQRYDDAVAEGRRVYAVIRASALNNDGSAKVGFTAPSVEGQAAVIRDALSLADVAPHTVGYIETHGTGTRIGDPIEIEALRSAYGAAHDASREASWEGGRIALGSAKATIGHLDAAAGVAGLIRAALAVRDGVIPPSSYFEKPNPLLELEDSPFHVPVERTAWPSGDSPRRAAVSSFGVGGTNAHVVLEQAPAAAPVAPTPRDRELLVLSAVDEEALERWRLRVADALGESDADARDDTHRLADAAHTLATGRRQLPHRLAVVAADAGEAVARLRDVDTRRIRVAGEPPAVVFLFPGQGAQRPGMAAGLHRVAPVFRQELDTCLELLLGEGVDLRGLLLDPDADATALNSTDNAQPALFAYSYALARQWQAWGVVPRAMAGHSIGEYVAACLAGVFDLPAALRLVAARGRLMAALPAGSMLAVALSEDEAAEQARAAGLDLAAVNGPRQCVLSGPSAVVDGLRRNLVDKGVQNRVLHTSHAFHSAMLDPMLSAFARELRAVRLREPSSPFISCLTGEPITAEQACDPAYWTAQARGTVRFGAGLDLLAAEPDAFFVEVGAGKGMTELARRHLRTLRHAPVASLPLTGGEPAGELLGALGQAWEAGAEIDWAAYYDGERRGQAALPGYPFARDRYWLDAPARSHQSAAPGSVPAAVDTGAATAETAAAGRGSGGARGGTEAVVLAVFTEAFGTDDINPDDDFFGLGGTSLLAAEVVHRLRRELNTEFPVRYLFEASQVSELAALIDGGTTGVEGASAVSGPGSPDDTSAELDDLAAELAGLSDDELARLLGTGPEGATA
ncbi:beta-ketoacyl synthase N-terminal-like domain-containing protein [Streptomyces sp. NPDC019396]|uniref:type I polyketide synthase n=1 Tax=Streptomyces sp. NPDC019396 TaxID=3154687 RepID=UPI0033FB028F